MVISKRALGNWSGNKTRACEQDKVQPLPCNVTIRCMLQFSVYVRTYTCWAKIVLIVKEKWLIIDGKYGDITIAVSEYSNRRQGTF